MEREFISSGARFTLFWAWEAPRLPWMRELESDSRAAQFVRGGADARSSAERLRHILRATWPLGDVLRLSDEQVLEQAGSMIAAGRLRVIPGFPRWPDRRGAFTSPKEETAGVSAKPVYDSGSSTKLTWIKIELVDEENEPVPGEEYELTLPDGSVRTGTLDGKGQAHEKGVDPGTCRVTFPRLDKDAWEFIESVAG